MSDCKQGNLWISRLYGNMVDIHDFTNNPVLSPNRLHRYYVIVWQLVVFHENLFHHIFFTPFIGCHCCRCKTILVAVHFKVWFGFGSLLPVVCLL